MTSSQSGAPSAFIPPNIVLPEDPEEMRLILTDYLIKIANAINIREIATYTDANLSSGSNINELVTGAQWFADNDVNAYRYVTRAVINIDGGLEDHGAAVSDQTQAHGITTTENTRFVRIYGCATDPGATTTTQAIPLPFVDVDDVNNGIELTVDATNVTLRYAPDYSAFSTAYVVLEWVEDTPLT